MRRPEGHIRYPAFPLPPLRQGLSLELGWQLACPSNPPGSTPPSQGSRCAHTCTQGSRHAHPHTHNSRHAHTHTQGSRRAYTYKVPGVHTLAHKVPGVHTLTHIVPGTHTLAHKVPGIHTLTHTVPCVHILTHKVSGMQYLHIRFQTCACSYTGFQVCTHSHTRFQVCTHTTQGSRHAHAHTPGCLCQCWDLHSGPHAFATNSLTHGASNQHPDLSYTFIMFLILWHLSLSVLPFDLAGSSGTWTEAAQVAVSRYAFSG